MYKYKKFLPKRKCIFKKIAFLFQKFLTYYLEFYFKTDVTKELTP